MSGDKILHFIIILYSDITRNSHTQALEFLSQYYYQKSYNFIVIAWQCQKLRKEHRNIFPASSRCSRLPPESLVSVSSETPHTIHTCTQSQTTKQQTRMVLDENLRYGEFYSSNRLGSSTQYADTQPHTANQNRGWAQ